MDNYFYSWSGGWRSVVVNISMETGVGIQLCIEAGESYNIEDEYSLWE